MSTNQEIAKNLAKYARDINRWRADAANLTLQVSQARQRGPEVEQLVALEKTASAAYEDINSFKRVVEEVAQKSPEAASQLAGISDALHLVLLELTELGVRLYSTRSGL